MEKITPADFYSRIQDKDDYKVTLDEDLYFEESSVKKLIDLFRDTEPTDMVLVGELDGNGYTIHNISSQLFKEVSSNGIIKNLTVRTNNELKKSTLCEINNGRIENVTVEAPLLLESSGGGLVSQNKGIIEDCVFKSESVAESEFADHIEHEFGGISAVNMGKIRNCTVHGDFKDFDHIGGIAGKNYRVINSCRFSNGRIESQAVGGIVSGNSGELKDCTISESVLRGVTVGGICGNNLSNGQITNSVCKGVELSHGTVGGIVGVNNGSLKNSGVDKYSIIFSGNYSGGLCGKLGTSGEIYKCSTNARIMKGDVSGGICGQLRGHSTCVKTYSDTSLVDGVVNGSLFGVVEGSPISSTVEDCYYIGDVKTQVVGRDKRSNTFTDNNGLHNVEMSEEQIITIMMATDSQELS